jgi:hypothetical protein
MSLDQLTESSADKVVWSRLLVLQSKRLLLGCAQRRFRQTGTRDHWEKAERLRTEADEAQNAYRASQLEWGSPKTSEYWLVAYDRLIEKGNAVSAKLRSAASGLEAADRFEVATDVELLEDLIKSWRESVRALMATSP